MRTTLRVLLPALLFMVGCKAGPRPFPEPQEPPPEAIRIEFEPPRGRTLVEHSTVTRTKRDPEGTAHKERVEATLHSRFEPNDEGYVFTQEIPSVRVTRDGVPVESPLVQLVTGFPLRVQLAKDGAFVRLLNPEDAEAAVRKAFPKPEEAEAVLRFFTPGALEAQARREWDSRYGELFGRNLRKGSVWYGVETLEVGGEQHPYLVERRVEGTKPTVEGRDLVIHLGCPATVQAAADPEAARQVLEAADIEEVRPVECDGEQLVALNPFLPRSTILEVRSGPVVFRREVRTEWANEGETREAE
ncbi:MAG: hypothetical protein WBV82_10080 [Myxococcaceae bacterium]